MRNTSDVTVRMIARHGTQPNRLFAWRKLAALGELTATKSQGIAPASEWCVYAILRARGNNMMDFTRYPVATTPPSMTRL